MKVPFHSFVFNYGKTKNKSWEMSLRMVGPSWTYSTLSLPHHISYILINLYFILNIRNYRSARKQNSANIRRRKRRFWNNHSTNDAFIKAFRKLETSFYIQTPDGCSVSVSIWWSSGFTSKDSQEEEQHVGSVKMKESKREK